MTVILCDNKATISMTKNPAFHSRTKHIDIRYHFIRNLVVEEIIALKYCGTNEQVVDSLTKSLPRSCLNFRMQMGLTGFEARGSVEQ